MTGIEINDNNGNKVGVLDVPMLDFSSLSRDGHTTLIHPVMLYRLNMVVYKVFHQQLLVMTRYIK